MIKKHYLLFSIVLLLINFFVACGVQTSPIAGGNSGKATTTRSTSIVHGQVDCPPVGTARAAISTPQTEGSHQAVIYTSYNDSVVNDTQQDESVINIYDTVTRQHRPIIMLPLHARIGEAHLSADGQWVLFIKSTENSNVSQDILQAVRTDGQGLQTLYCANINGFLSDIHWSPDQHYIAFEEYEVSPGAFAVKLLNSSTGSITTLYEVAMPGRVRPMRWLDNTHLYIASYQKAEYIGLWDVTKSTQQQVKDVVTIAANESFVDIDISKDHTKLFVSSCTISGGNACDPSNPSGRITVQPVTGTTRIPIYASPTLTVRSIQVASSTTLLFTGQLGDSNSGLWKINQDGSNLTHLIKSAPEQLLEIGDLAPDGANISPDDSLYAVQVKDFKTDALEIGSLSGGVPTIALSAKYREPQHSFDIAFNVVGWTKV